jgi:hypothetical protein
MTIIQSPSPDVTGDEQASHCAAIECADKDCCKRRKKFRGVDLHLDNAPAHNAKRLWQAIARTKATRVVHPGYSPDDAPSNFILFGYLKGEVAGLATNSPADILYEIRRTVQEISKETVVAVYGEWITRLEWIAYHKESTITPSKRIQYALK